MGGLCYNCYESKKREDKGLLEKPCPICGLKVNKFGQHLAMLSKSCDKHREVLTSLEDEAVELFGSNLTSVQISEKVGISKDRILKLWHKVFSDEEIRNRGERIRISKISGKNHYFNVKGITWSNLGRETYLYDEIGFRSTWEVNLAQYLDNIGVDWEYECSSFQYVDMFGVSRAYWPDFYIPHLRTFIEVKGFLSDKDAYKIKAVVKRYNLDLVLFLEDDPEKLWDELILNRKK